MVQFESVQKKSGYAAYRVADRECDRQHGTHAKQLREERFEDRIAAR